MSKKVLAMLGFSMLLLTACSQAPSKEATDETSSEAVMEDEGAMIKEDEGAVMEDEGTTVEEGADVMEKDAE